MYTKSPWKNDSDIQLDSIHGEVFLQTLKNISDMYPEPECKKSYLQIIR